jgi:YHS domain-containing protein
MLGWVIRLLLVFFILRAVSRLFHGIGEGLRGPRVQTPSAVALVRDPVCGTFVMPSHAIVAGSGTAARFFCSEKCRRAYESTRAQGQA